MNLAQRIILIVTFFIVLSMALVPPWLYVYNPPSHLKNVVKSERLAGYYPFIPGPSLPDQKELIQIFDITVGAYPEVDDRWIAGLQFFSTRIDGTRLTTQIVITLLLAALLYFALHTKRPQAQ